MDLIVLVTKHFPLLFELYQNAIIYNLYVFAAAAVGSFTLRALLVRGIKTLKNQDKINGTVAFLAKFYFTLKSLITPFIIVFMSITSQMHKTEKHETSIVIDRLLVNFNEASSLLTPELQIMHLMKK